MAACFSWAWLVQVLVAAAIIAGVYAIVMLLLGKIPLGEPFTTAMQVVRIVVWVVITIAIIYFCADLISCAFGGGFPRVRG